MNIEKCKLKIEETPGRRFGPICNFQFAIFNLQFLPAALLLALAANVSADSIRTRNVTHKDVRVVGLREGQLFYRAPNGDERSVPLDEVRALELDRYPNLGKANEAFAREDFEGAARLLAPLADTAQENYVRVLAGAQLVGALDRSGKFLEAARRYTKLLQTDTGALVRSVRPQNLPKDAADRTAAAERLAADARGVTDPIARRYLDETVAQLKGDASAAPVESAAPRPQAGLLRTAGEADLDPIDDALAAAKYEQALRMTDEALKAGGSGLAKLLHQRGRAQAALGRTDDALLSYMRVVIHFSPRSGPFYGLSLLEAGKLFAEQQNAGHARQLLTEARAIYGEETAERKEIEKLLAELPAQ